MSGFACDRTAPADRFALPTRIVRSVGSGVLAGLAGLMSLASLAGCGSSPSATAGAPTRNAAASPTGSAVLTVANPTWDMGEVLVKGKALDLDHTFRLENHSSRPVSIREVRTDCGCLVAKDHVKEVAAGGSADLTVTISVFGPPGPFRKSIVVREEGGPDAVLTLGVVGRRALNDHLTSAPQTVNFGMIARGGSKTRAVTISRYDGSPVRFREVLGVEGLRMTGKPSSINTIDTTGRAIDLVEIPIELNTTAQPIGPLRARLTVLTEGEEGPASRLSVDVEAIVTEEASPWVKSVFIDRLGAGESVERLLTEPAAALDGLPAVAGLTFEGDASLRVELVQDGSGSKRSGSRVRVSRPAGVGGGGLARGTLIVRTGKPDGPVTRIGLVAYLPK